MKIEQNLQKNGLETIFINSTGSTLGSVQIWFRAGSALENKSNEGIAHFLEHMFFKGTKKRPGAKIASDVESFGGEINAFTSFDYTCYYINCPDDKITESIDILLDMVSSPRFLQKELEPEREVVFEEYRRSVDNPNQYSFFQIQKNIFSGQYSHPILGREQTIKQFTRKQLIDFRKENYNNQNAFFVVAGDLDTDSKLKNKITKKINHYKLPNGKKSVFPKFSIKKTNKFYIHFKDVEMAQVSLCFQAPPLSEKNAAIEDLAINCLGHGQSSLLYKELVLKDTLANNCSSTSMFMRDGGFHFLRVSTPVENLSQTLDELRVILKNSLENGISDNEVTKIKNQYLASKTYDQESLENFSFSIGHSFASTMELDSEDKFIGHISAATTKETNNALKEILARNLQVSVQLPLNEKAKTKSWKSIFENFQKRYTKDFHLKNETKVKAKKVKFTQSKFDPQSKLYQINDQVQLFYKRNDSAPTFVLHAYLQGGLSLENSKDNGVHHLLGQMLDQGYEGVSADQLQSDLDFKAATMSGFTGKNAYGLTCHSLSSHFDELTKHMMNSFFAPTFDQERFQHEKELTLRSLEVAKKDPVKQCFDKASSFLFNNHPYSMDLLGTEKNVKSFTTKDLKDTHSQNLKDGKIIFSYSGNLEAEQVLDTIDLYLKNKTFSKPKKNIFNNQVKAYKDKIEHITFDREQTQIFIGFATSEMRNKEHLYLKMLTSYLGGQSSPLFVDVRDKKGLCYSAQPVHFAALEAGYWAIYMASGHDKVEKAKDAIYSLFDDLCKKGLSKTDFNNVKNKISGSQKLQLQTNSDYINFYTINSLHGLGLDYFHKQLVDIKNIKYDDFQRNIKKILQRPTNIITVGR